MSFVQGLGDLGGGILALILYLGTTTKRNWFEGADLRSGNLPFFPAFSGW